MNKAFHGRELRRRGAENRWERKPKPKPKLPELPMARMIAVLLDLYDSDRALFEYVLIFLAAPLHPMRNVAKRFGVTRQNAEYRIQRAAGIYPELSRLLSVRRNEIGIIRKAEGPDDAGDG